MRDLARWVTVMAMAFFKCGVCGTVFNATQAFLDYGSMHHGQKLTPYKKPKVAPIGEKCVVAGPRGEAYCELPVREGRYCARHSYLA